jgi:hypothetical protein
MVESKSAASMSDRVCSAAITELRSRGIRYRAYDQKGFPTMAVSHAIAALEARHETKLFDRIGRRIALTEACRVFLMEARAILARAGAAELAQSEFGSLKRGTLCVQASQTIAGYTLPRHLVAFQRAYPRLWIQRPSSERRRDFNPPIHTLPSAHYEPLRHPRAPGLSLTGFRLVSRTPPWGFPYFVTCLAIEEYGLEKTEDRTTTISSSGCVDELSSVLARDPQRARGSSASMRI